MIDDGSSLGPAKLVSPQEKETPLSTDHWIVNYSHSLAGLIFKGSVWFLFELFMSGLKSKLR